MLCANVVSSETPAQLAAGVRVVIDALPARYGGAAVATIEIAPRLAAHDAIDEVVVVARRGSLVATGLDRAPGVRLVTLRSARRLERLRRIAWQAAALPGLAASRPRTAVLTWSGMLPRTAGAGIVCFHANPAIFAGGRPADRIRLAAARRTARRAATLLVPTAALAEVAAPALGCEAHVVALGVDHARFGPADEPGRELLCVADGYRHKRHDLVLEAWSALPEPRPTLRLVGDPAVEGPAQESALAQAIRQHSGDGTIVVQTHISADALVATYRGARVVILASEQESFSLPLLEAQACGVPAVVRDLPALHETGGAATTFVSGDDPAAWSAAVARLFADDGAHARARTAALAHAAGYDWDRTSAELAAHLARSAQR